MCETNMNVDEQTALQTVEQAQNELSNVWENKEAFNQLLRAAQMLSQTTIIPQPYQGKPQDCFVAIEMANRMGLLLLW